MDRWNFGWIDGILDIFAESIHENEDEEEDEDSSGELSFDSAVFHSDCDSDSNSSDSSDASLHTCMFSTYCILVMSILSILRCILNGLE